MKSTRQIGRVVLAAPIAIFLIANCRDPRETTAPPHQVGGEASLATVTANADNTVAADVLVGAGDIASCTTQNDQATATLLDGIAGTVFTLGDNAYSSGTTSEYADCYAPTWGRHKERTRPAAGDRDYTTAGAPAYFTYFGAAAGDPTQGYYSYDLPSGWHVVVLNTALSASQATAQLAWLKADLKASGSACTVAYWHKPYFSSALAPSASRRTLWEMLYGFGAEIILSADSKYYERFARQDPNEVADEVFGVRQFIVGTGGAGKTAAPGSRRVNSEVLNSGTPGVLKLTLAGGTYEWEFVPIAGMSFTDVGAGTCHGYPPPVAKPGGPYAAERTVVLDGRTSIDYQDDNPLTYAWDFGDGSPIESGDRPTHTYAVDGVYTVTLVVTDALGNVSAPATTTATISNQPPSVELFAKSGALGTALTPKLTFSDAGGAADGPWSYSIAWGDGTTSTGVVETQGVIPVSHIYPALGKYLATATVSDALGAAASDPANMTVVSPTGGSVILAAGDIADCGALNRDELTAQVLDQVVAAVPSATVFTLGDNAYPNGTLADYNNCYGPTWGRHKDRTYAALGNHEYQLGNADPSWDYFGDRAGPRGKGYYSVDIGDWHIVVLNDNLPIGSTSEQLAWLRTDLAASTKKCQIAIWHQPRFMSSDDGFNIRTTRKTLWDRLYAAGVEIALNAHQHFYERHHPMNPDGVRDDATGILQLMVGTGGESTKDPATLTFLSPNSVVRSSAFGVLKLTLHPNAYEWQFLAAPGYALNETGGGVCR